MKINLLQEKSIHSTSLQITQKILIYASVSHKKLVNECFHYAESEQIIRLPRREYVNNRRPIETGLSQFVGQFIPSLDYAKRLGESLARDISKIAYFNTKIIGKNPSFLNLFI